MAASYPNSAKSFTTKTNGQTIDPAHINDLQDEVTAVEQDLIAGLPVARGGTGNTTLTANRVLLGNGTSAIAVAGAGTAGQVLTSNGPGVNPTYQDGGDASQIVFTPAQNNPPSTIYATPDVRNSHPVLDFDATTSEEAIFPGVFWEDYAGENVTATIVWAASTATSGNVKWNVGFERLAADGVDIDADGFGTAQTATGAANATSGKLTYTTVTFTSSQIAGLLAGEAFRLLVARHASDGADTMTGDAEFLRVVLRKVPA